VGKGKGKRKGKGKDEWERERVKRNKEEENKEITHTLSLLSSFSLCALQTLTYIHNTT
jgi:hypothetical protein